MENGICPYWGMAMRPVYDPVKNKKGRGSVKGIIKQLVMLKLILLLMTAWLQVSAKGYAQGLTLSLHNTSLEKVFTAIEQQSSYHFIYTKEELQASKPVSITVSNARLADVLEHCFKGQGLLYTIKESYIIIKKKESTESGHVTAVEQTSTLSGRVMNEEGEPIIGATISIN